jgi:YMGG-like Gly-zipper
MRLYPARIFCQEAIMNRLTFTLPVVALLLAACQTSDQNAALGALGGAAVGAAVSSDEDRTKGALIGAAVGVAASTLIGPAPTQGKCYYRDQYGQRFIANC